MKLSIAERMLLSEISMNPKRYSPKTKAVKAILALGFAEWKPENLELLIITDKGRAALAEPL